MQSFCCDVENCVKKPNFACMECDPIRILCFEHDTELHDDGDIKHTRDPIISKCSFKSCLLPITAFCKTQHRRGLCDSHNKLVHPEEHKCKITGTKLIPCPTCSIPCALCNDTTCELKKESISYICDECKPCNECNSFGTRLIPGTTFPSGETCYSCNGTKIRRCRKCGDKRELILKPLCPCVQDYAINGCETCGVYKHVSAWQARANLRIKVSAPCHIPT
ncbi:MAG: hypothetical protein Harvfovirus26_17 [Harvfovirus sp.]|uniref:Uncharacterized protein n=1 Tax=Harvfovirus sp. TaxID=2487768 RepID=A0A3G5A773_9VIRU|nr:MAG: hypothetical protein Harvfovirus26_17 [Harvfovirus sp.]